MSDVPGRVDVDRVMRTIESDVQRDRRTRLVARGGPDAYRDPDLYAEVERALRRAADREDGGTSPLLLPELADDADQWRLEIPLRLSSHRPVLGKVFVWAKRQMALPVLRWLYQYSAQNFRKQQRVNRLLFACVEELAIENAKLRREIASRLPAPDRDQP
jgi:hypothetical protein